VRRVNDSILLFRRRNQAGFHGFTDSGAPKLLPIKATGTSDCRNIRPINRTPSTTFAGEFANLPCKRRPLLDSARDHWRHVGHFAKMRFMSISSKCDPTSRRPQRIARSKILECCRQSPRRPARGRGEQKHQGMEPTKGRSTGIMAKMSISDLPPGVGDSKIIEPSPWIETIPGLPPRRRSGRCPHRSPEFGHAIPGAAVHFSTHSWSSGRSNPAIPATIRHRFNTDFSKQCKIAPGYSSQ